MNPKEKLKFQPTVAIPPGETLLELINTLNITQAELARRMGRPLKLVNEIIKGKTSVTPETAIQFEQVLGKPAAFWNSLESTYQDLKLRQDQESKFKEMLPEAKMFPYNEMVKHKWLQKTNDQAKKVEWLLQFFSVTSFENIVEKAALAGVFSISTKHKYSLPAIYAWLRQGVRQAETTGIKSFDRDKLIQSIPLIKALTNAGPEVFVSELTKVFADCGIAFAVIPELTNAPIFGSTRWLAPDVALIQLSIRLKWADFFWFHLFHEIGHVLFDNKKDFNIDFRKNNPNRESEEKANTFAQNTLIDPATYTEIESKVKNLLSRNLKISPLIKEYATRLKIHPGIIVGRLQHEKIIPYSFNQLRVKLGWTEDE